MMSPRAEQIFQASREAGWILEPLAKEILAERGLPVPVGRWVRTEEEARSAAAELGYPLVAKVVSPAVLHKSDVQGVALGLSNEAEALAAFGRFAAMEKSQGMLLERMGKGIELIVGARFDRQFGPIVLVGLGGTGVEVYKDVAIRLAPVTEAEAEAALLSLAGARLLQGYRGRPKADLQAIRNLIAAFSRLLMELGDRAASIDLNPVLCNDTGALIADARIMLR